MSIWQIAYHTVITVLLVHNWLHFCDPSTWGLFPLWKSEGPYYNTVRPTQAVSRWKFLGVDKIPRSNRGVSILRFEQVKDDKIVLLNQCCHEILIHDKIPDVRSTTLLAWLGNCNELYAECDRYDQAFVGKLVYTVRLLRRFILTAWAVLLNNCIPCYSYRVTSTTSLIVLTRWWTNPTKTLRSTCNIRPHHRGYPRSKAPADELIAAQRQVCAGRQTRLGHQLVRPRKPLEPPLELQHSERNQ